jgi:hypothetical protein
LTPAHDAIDNTTLASYRGEKQVISNIVSIVSALIAVAAAVYAARQARAAKRQADAAHGDVQPTFHTELHEDNGRPPWGFQLSVRNFNRRPLRIKAARIRVPDGLIVWEAADTRPDTIRATIQAAARTGEVSFPIEKILEGVSPTRVIRRSTIKIFTSGSKRGPTNGDER